MNFWDQNQANQTYYFIHGVLENPHLRSLKVPYARKFEGLHTGQKTDQTDLYRIIDGVPLEPPKNVLSNSGHKFFLSFFFVKRHDSTRVVVIFRGKTFVPLNG